MKWLEIRAPWWRITVVHCALVMALGVLWPTAHARSNAVVWEENDQAVLLATQDDETAAPNDHPVTIGPQVIENMLAGLRFRYRDQEPATPAVAVFNEDQVGILGEALATGLARAGPSQDVTFSVVGAHRLSPGAFARRNRLTAGRVFFREGKLNLIFGEIQSSYRKKNVYGRIDEDFYPRKYGRRATAEEHDSILVANAAASLWGAPGNARDDWVVFDLGPARADRAAPPPPTARTAPEESGPEPAAGASRPAPAATVDIAGRREEVDAADIERRLETLKRLREKGLISEEAYRQKADEILEEL
jgi:hypothetical protein